MPTQRVPSWVGFLGSGSFLWARRQLLNCSEIYIYIYICIPVLWVGVILCRSCEREEVYHSSESHRKRTTTFCSEEQSFPSVKLGRSSGSCPSPSKAELAVGSGDGNWFKIAGISFRSKKCNYSQGWETFLGISRKEASVSAGDGWREGCADSRSSSCTFLPWPQHSWCLVSCLGLSVILWIMEHLMRREE